MLLDNGRVPKGAKNVGEVRIDELVMLAGTDDQGIEGESIEKAERVDECFGRKMLVLAARERLTLFFRRSEHFEPSNENKTI